MTQLYKGVCIMSTVSVENNEFGKGRISGGCDHSKTFSTPQLHRVSSFSAAMTFRSTQAAHVYTDGQAFPHVTTPVTRVYLRTLPDGTLQHAHWEQAEQRTSTITPRRS